MTNKEENATFKPLVPKWRDCGDEHRLVLNLSQSAKWEFSINAKTLRAMSYIGNAGIAISCEDVGLFDSVEEAKAKVNEAIKWLGETLVYYSENIRIKE